jgi:iron complex transport system permease protein
VVRFGRTGFSRRLPARALVVTVAAAVLLVVTICLTLAFGEYPISLVSVIRVLTGQGDSIQNLVILQFRFPRIALAALVGAALGLSGGLFQLLTRNPLASPDIIGVSEGAAVAGALMITANVSLEYVPLGAFAGALAAVSLVAVFGVRRRLSFYRLILVGIAINIFGYATVAYLVARASVTQAGQLAEQWLLGSVSAPGWQDSAVLGIAMAVLVPLALLLSRHLNALQLGDDLAGALGVSSRRVQLALAAIGSMLAAAAVSVAGPISFVAFVSPHIGRRLTRTSSAASLPAGMLIGALLLLLADYAGQRIFEPNDIPVGISTIVLGAPYLLFLLFKAERDTGVA